MSDSVDMQELFKEAAKIAAVVPESMQEAAFHRALDALLGNTETAAATKSISSRRRTKKQAPGGGKRMDQDNRVSRVTAVPRDEAPEVDKETSVLGRSIALLVVASREADVDGLTAPEIAQILTEKFRHRTTRQAVQSALDGAGNMIDRQRLGNSAAIYRVMRPGEEWLGKPPEERASGSSRRRAGTKSVTASPPKKRASAQKSSLTKKSAAASRSSNAARRTGPKAALEVLISEGFFKEPRGIADIRKELRDQKALNFASTDLSPGLTRLLREGKLMRTKTEKQYVYSAG